MLRSFLQRFLQPTPAGRPPIDTPLAVCAVLLEAAGADDDFTPAERHRIAAALEDHFGLDPGEADALIEAAHARRAEMVDLFRFTRVINETMTRDEKTRLAETMWHILYSDGRLTAYEDRLAHKLEQLLNLDHQLLMATKVTVLRAREAGTA